MKRLMYFLLFVGAASVAHPQVLQVAASVNRRQILIGEPLQLTLRVQMPEAHAVTWFALDSFPHFEILHRSAIDTVRSGAGDQILVQNIRITSWDSGRWNLPAFALPRSNRTRPITVLVNYTPMDPAQPYHEIKDIRTVDRPAYQRWWWYLVGLALLLLFLLLLFPGKKKKEAAPPPPETAYRNALKQLAALEKQRDTAPAKEWYSQLVDVLRVYLAHRKGYHSTDKTTADLQTQLPQWGLQPAAAGALSAALQLSDGVKFARFDASPEERKTSLLAVRQAIEGMEQVKTSGV